MKIAIIGTGNVGGALAEKWAIAGHEITLGVRDLQSFKGQSLLQIPGISVSTIHDSVKKSEVILLATPAMFAAEVAESLGDTSGKIIIDSMNIVMKRGPLGFSNTTDAVIANTNSTDVVKCFNTTGFNNMKDPVYNGVGVDIFVAGNSEVGVKTAQKLALDAGFENCFHIGGNDKFELMEQFAWFWINLAMFQGMGREFAFKILKR